MFCLLRCGGRSSNNSPEIRRWVGAWIAAPPSLQRVWIGERGISRACGAVDEVAALNHVEVLEPRATIRRRRFNNINGLTIKHIVPGVEWLRFGGYALSTLEERPYLVSAPPALKSPCVFIPGVGAIARTTPDWILRRATTEIGNLVSTLIWPGRCVIEEHTNTRAPESRPRDRETRAQCIVVNLEAMHAASST